MVTLLLFLELQTIFLLKSNRKYCTTFWEAGHQRVFNAPIDFLNIYIYMIEVDFVNVITVYIADCIVHSVNRLIKYCYSVCSLVEFVYLHSKTLQQPVTLVIVVRTKCTHWILFNSNVKTINCITLYQI
jgi:hypothetical protein